MKTTLVTLMMSIVLLSGCATMAPTTPTNDGMTGSNDPMTATGEVPTPPSEVAEDMYDLTVITVQANGTEPFWNFVASGSMLTWNEPTSGGTIATTPYTITMSQTPITVTLSSAGLIAVLTLQTCSDGMSDVVYTHEAIVTKGAEIYSGCANISL